MRSKLTIPVVLLLFLYCDFFPQGGNSVQTIKLNAPMTLLQTTKAVKSLKINHANSSFKETINKIDLICSKSILDSSKYNIDALLDESLKAKVPDDELAVYSSINNEYTLEISFNELSFRLLNSIQRKLEELFNKLPSTQKMATIPIFLTTGNEIAQEKTLLIRRQIWILTSSEKKDERIRCWLAIKRMLDEIDIPKSESGDLVAQRSPYGILISKGEIINKLTTLSENETDSDIKTYSDSIVTAINSAGPKYKELSAVIAINELENYDPSKSKVNEGALKIFGQASQGINRAEKIILYSRAISLDSNFTAAYYNRGVCYYEQGNYGNAAKDFNKVLNLDNGYFTSYKFLGNISYNSGNYREAAKYFSEALKYDISDTLFLCRGLCNQKIKQYRQALTDYSSVIKLNPNFHEAYKNRAQCYLAVKLYDNALQDFRKLIKFEPYNSVYYYNLGFIYSVRNDWNKVVEAWEKGLTVNPGDENIKKNLPAARAKLSKQKLSK